MPHEAWCRLRSHSGDLSCAQTLSTQVHQSSPCLVCWTRSRLNPEMRPGRLRSLPAKSVGKLGRFRTMASMEVEESIRGNPIDEVVLLMACDDTTPSILIGAASCDLQTSAGGGLGSGMACTSATPGVGGKWNRANQEDYP